MDNKFIAVLLTSFRAGYLGAWSEGLLTEKSIRTALRAAAFAVLAEQHEEADLRRVLAKLEDALEECLRRILAGDVGKGPSARVRPLFKK